MRIFLSYAKSHIYDIHAALVAVITIVSMHFIKQPIKQRVSVSVEAMLQKRPERERQRALYLKRGNMVLVLITMLLAFALFALAAVISPMIQFSVESGIMSGVFALAGYAFLEQMTYGMKR